MTRHWNTDLGDWCVIEFLQKAQQVVSELFSFD